MSKMMTTAALAMVSMAFGYALSLQSMDVVDEIAFGTVTYGLEYAFVLLLAGIGLWSLTQKAGRRVGATKAGVTVMIAGLLGFLIPFALPV